MLDVMDVRTQKNMEMTMKEWQQYFDNPDKDRLLNVISLEFSHTKLDKQVEAPTVVRTKSVSRALCTPWLCSLRDGWALSMRGDDQAWVEVLG